MTQSEWKPIIIQSLIEIGMNLPQYEMIVDTLAATLEQRDNALQEFINSGAKIGVIKTSDRGAKNLSRNPILAAWMDLNAAALQLWRECCLTPAAFNKVSIAAQQSAAGKNVLEQLLSKLTEE